MANGQKRGNREARKPKPDKPKVIAAVPQGSWRPPKVGAKG
jgi:hypothetical protein